MKDESLTLNVSLGLGSVVALNFTQCIFDVRLALSKQLR